MDIVLDQMSHSSQGLLRADEKYDWEAYEGEAASETIIEEGGYDGSEEPASSKQWHDVRGDLGIVGIGEAGTVGRESEVFFKAFEGQNAPHYTSVVVISLLLAFCFLKCEGDRLDTEEYRTHIRRQGQEV